MSKRAKIRSSEEIEREISYLKSLSYKKTSLLEKIIGREPDKPFDLSKYSSAEFLKLLNQHILNKIEIGKAQTKREVFVEAAVKDALKCDVIKQMVMEGKSGSGVRLPEDLHQEILEKLKLRRKDV